MSLPDTTPTRKQRFNAALELAGLTIEDWRTRIHPVSRQHLNEVLSGSREPSAELDAAINRVIDKYLPAPPKRAAAGR